MGALGLLAGGGGFLSGQNPPRPARAQTTASQPDDRPNIILILTDDMRADDLPYLPAVQELLVAQGATFTSFACSSPGCAPARASILRGQYPHNHGLLRSSGNVAGEGDFHNGRGPEAEDDATEGAEVFRALGNEASTIATWLQGAGYRTALIGKYLNSYGATVEPTYIPPGWDQWFGVTNEGYDRFELNANGSLIRYKSGKVEVCSTDVLAEKASAFLAETTASTRPFFLLLTPRAPHGPAEPASRHLDAFADLTFPRHAGFNEADVSDKPTWVRVLPEITEAQLATMEAYFRARLQTLLAVDEMVSRIVEALQAAGVLDNTYVLFSSDNGFHRGEHRIVRDKGSPYEEAVLVPLVVRGPGIPAGVTIEALASQVDLAPTFAAWAGVTPPPFVDGRSLAPVLGGDAAPNDGRRALLVQQYADRSEDSVKQPGFNALRGDDFIYVEYYSGERELYDLAQDPYELNNLATTGDRASLAALSERLTAMTDCAGEACRAIEETPLPWALPRTMAG